MEDGLNQSVLTTRIHEFDLEIEKRVGFIREQLKAAGASGIVYGNSGGKDSALVGILCKKACDNTVGLIMPCSSETNYGSDMSDALLISKEYGIEVRTIDLTSTAQTMKSALSNAVTLTRTAEINIAPRLRMTTLYACAAAENRLVAGTGNRSEGYMGYFTKWGDGAFDFNPIADLTVTEIYEFLAYLGAPKQIIKKPPSAGLFSGQTDEAEMGVTYRAIDEYLLGGAIADEDMSIILRYHKASEHKRNPPITYG